MTEITNSVTFTINGREITVPEGTTILDAAKLNGINIPTFCWHPKLKPVGACRICYVEIEKVPKLQVSCATEAVSGMVVHTESEKVKAGRRAVLEFILLNHPLDCPTCDKGGECDLQDNTFAHGVDDSRFDFDKYRFIRDRKSTFDDYRIGPEIIRNQNRCILCYKCVRANKEAFGEYDIGVFQRGNVSEIDAAPGQQVDSIYSGNLVEICPVGALTNTDWRYKIRVWKTQKSKSICCYCGDGCNLTLWKDRNKVHRATSRRNDAIDEGWICDIGRYGYQIADAENRLTHPLIKKGERQVPVNWEEAIEHIAQKFKNIKDKKGGVCIGGMISPSLDSLSLYAFSKYFRTVLQSNNIDFRADYKMLPEKYGDLYTKMTLLPFKIADIEKSDLILAIGSNLIREHPIINLRVRKAVMQKGAKLVTINPFATKSADIAIDDIIYRAGTLDVFLNGVCLVLIEKKPAGTNINTNKFKSMIFPDSIEDCAKISKIEPERIIALAEMIGKAHNITILAGDFISQSNSRELLSNAIHNLALLSGAYQNGQIGFLSRNANSKGAQILGLMPHLSPESVEYFKNLWGVYPDRNGLAVDRMILAAKKEEFDSLFIAGVNPIVQYPDGQFVKEGLQKLDFLVVADLYETETTELADVVLPMAGWAEYSGSFVNTEGTIQQFEKAFDPVGDSLPVYEIIDRIANKCNRPIAAAITQLEEEVNAALQFDESVNIEMQPKEVKHIEEKYETGFEIPLYIADNLHHFGHWTERSKSLGSFCSEPYLEISPSLAERLEVEKGMMVRIESEVGKVIFPVYISEHIDNDIALIIHNCATTPVNILQMRKRRIDRVKLTKVEEA
jgi:NADH-quinone oxidoreductase subunit G